MQRGFSLVELSIVLVILGLLTGGILAGQSLIRAAELRAITTEYSRYITSAQTFRDKYFAIPGDFTKATAFWGFDNAAAGCANLTGAANASPGACDGDGDGLLDGATLVSTASERPQFWKHLSLAGLIEGSFTGMVGPVSVSDAPIGQAVPASRLSGAGWWPTYYTASSSHSSFAYNHGNSMVVGARSATTGSVGAAFLKPEEMWNIDTKLDDGRPGMGKVLARQFTTCTTATVNTNFSADYLLTSNAVGCSILIREAF